MSNYLENNFEKTLREHLEEYGFRGFRVVCTPSSTCQYFYEIEIVKNVQVDLLEAREEDSDNAALSKQLHEQVISNIQNSTYLKKIKSQYETEIRELKETVERLREYETYYKMQYRLNHAEKITSKSSKGL